MFQPQVKHEFVRRYCPPTTGWRVFVDIDASELGRTGGERETAEAEARRTAMLEEGERAIGAMKELGVTVGGSRTAWLERLRSEIGPDAQLSIPGDRDIVALHPELKRLIVAEAEGQSSGQPEGKLYKALGQIVMAASEVVSNGFNISYIIVIHGDKVGNHLKRAAAIRKLGISGLQLMPNADEDRWLIPPPLYQYPSWVQEMTLADAGAALIAFDPIEQIIHEEMPIGEWPGKCIVELDNMGDAGGFINDHIEADISYFMNWKSETDADDLADDYIKRCVEYGCPFPTDFTPTLPTQNDWDEEREKIRAEFRAFLMEWQRRVLARLGAREPEFEGGEP